MKYILAKKIEMTQMFDNEGKVIPVTLVLAGPCEILQLKTKEKDGYEAVQIGFEQLKEKKVTKSIKTKPYRYLKEFRGIESEKKIGDKIDVSVFNEGDKIKISSISKGKGFQGGVKRWGFHGKTASHGVKHEHRTIGSVGYSSPSRVVKGKKMPGRTGSKRVTMRNLEIRKIDQERNILAIKGAIPGRRGTLIEIRG
ncbi:MAG TPA: 50S ribosomal protein L3 [Candidatus Pacearchaeota archaeon]|mgnify:CR=1 FL=1|nr:50S ribosomal protein L3 [Candidatus Pacearchaeota archaeon]